MSGRGRARFSCAVFRSLWYIYSIRRAVDRAAPRGLTTSVLRAASQANCEDFVSCDVWQASFLLLASPRACDSNGRRRPRFCGKRPPLELTPFLIFVDSGSLERLGRSLMVGIGTAERDASTALLGDHFHEIAIFKGGALEVGSRRCLGCMRVGMTIRNRFSGLLLAL